LRSAGIAPAFRIAVEKPGSNWTLNAEYVRDPRWLERGARRDTVVRSDRWTLLALLKPPRAATGLWVYLEPYVGGGVSFLDRPSFAQGDADDRLEPVVVGGTRIHAFGNGVAGFVDLAVDPFFRGAEPLGVSAGFTLLSPSW
jgi:hypothetical protein